MKPLFLLFCLSVTFLIACGGGEEPTPVTPEPTPVVTPEPTPEPTIVFTENPVLPEYETSLEYTITAVPDSIVRGRHPIDTTFYKKCVFAMGIPVLCAAEVSDQALVKAAEIVRYMLQYCPETVKKMLSFELRVGIVGVNQVTTDMPEYANLYELWPDTDWNSRARGLGATEMIPLVSCGEENLLMLRQDGWYGENIMIHEFAHVVDQMGLSFTDKSFKRDRTNCFKLAKEEGLWNRTYALENEAEYWAEGVQDWFNCNLQANPANGIHNYVNTRDELKEYDPRLAELISRYFTSGTRDFMAE